MSLSTVTATYCRSSHDLRLVEVQWDKVIFLCLKTFWGFPRTEKEVSRGTQHTKMPDQLSSGKEFPDVLLNLNTAK